MNRSEITNGAYFLAKVYHDAYQQAELERGGLPVAGWTALAPTDRLVMALGFQKMIDLGVISPISFDGVKKLRAAGWQSVATSAEKSQRPGPSDLRPRS